MLAVFPLFIVVCVEVAIITVLLHYYSTEEESREELEA